MILLNDGLRIERLDERCVAVQKKQIRKKDGEEYWNTLSYHGDVVSALKAVRRRRLIRFIGENTITLSELIEKLERLDEQFIVEIKECISEMED